VPGIPSTDLPHSTAALEAYDNAWVAFEACTEVTAGELLAAVVAVEDSFGPAFWEDTKAINSLSACVETFSGMEGFLFAKHVERLSA